VTIWLTADTHFSHHNVIEYCARPYSGIEEMNEDMIRRWNDVVHATDLVYHLGDFGLSPARKLGQIRQKLKGRIVLIRGNHDFGIKPKRWKEEVGIDDVVDKIDVDEFTLRHLPAKEEDMVFFSTITGQWLLCGHVHERWLMKERQYNVGVDMNNFTPISLEQVRKNIENLENQKKEMGLV